MCVCVRVRLRVRVRARARAPRTSGRPLQAWRNCCWKDHPDELWRCKHKGMKQKESERKRGKRERERGRERGLSKQCNHVAVKSSKEKRTLFFEFPGVNDVKELNLK